MDDHPINIHIMNFQIIGMFKFNLEKYEKDWEEKNGKLGQEVTRQYPSNWM